MLFTFSKSRLKIFFILSLTITPYAVASSNNNAQPTEQHINPPPSATLSYEIRAQYGLLPFSGSAQIDWHNREDYFSVRVTTNTILLGEILNSRSEGIINAYGLSPTRLTETRFRKNTHTVNFDQKSRLIRFSASEQTYPLDDGAQDRTSLTWQLISIARGAPENFISGATWTFLVAGRRNAEISTFTVLGEKTLTSPLAKHPTGKLQTVHLFRQPTQTRKGRTLDIWLAPSLEWYPVKMVAKDGKGWTITQTLHSISKHLSNTGTDTPNQP